MCLISDVVSDKTLRKEQKIKQIKQILIDSPNEATKTNRSGLNVLHRAVVFEDSEKVDILLQAGISPYTVGGKYGRTALHFASERGCPNIVSLLLAIEGIAVDQTDTLDKTPLYLASESGNPGVVKLLLEAGASPNKTIKCGRTPLHAAVSSIFHKNRTECISLLIAGCANIYQKDHHGKTSLDLAPKLSPMMQEKHMIHQKFNFFLLGLNHASITYHARMLYFLKQRNTQPLSSMPNEMIARIVLFTGQKPPILDKALHPYYNIFRGSSSILTWLIKEHSPTHSDTDIQIALSVLEGRQSQKPSFNA